MMFKEFVDGEFRILLLTVAAVAAWAAWPQQGPAPTKPRPVENWTAPPRDVQSGGSVIPANPPAREITPLQPPRRIEGPVFGNRPIDPAPIPPVDISAIEDPEWSAAPTDEEGLRELFQDSIHPIVLSPERYLSIAGQGVSLRDGPGVDYRKTATLFQGDLVEWRDEDDGWHRVVIASGTDGWVSSQYTERVPQRVALVTGERVHLRDAPSDQSRILGSLYLGAVATAMETFGDWTQVRTPNLKNAYVASEHLVQLSENQTPPFPLEPHPELESPAASLARLGGSATGEVEYLLAVQPGDWVKGGKVGLLYLSDYSLPFFGEDPDPPPSFVEGAFFEKLLLRNQYATGFGRIGNWTEQPSSILVGYLRGRKEGPVWTYTFKFSGGGAEGRFALCRQKGDRTGAFLPIQAAAFDSSE